MLCDSVAQRLPLAVQVEHESVRTLDRCLDVCDSRCVTCWCSVEIVGLTEQRVLDGFIPHCVVLAASTHLCRHAREIRAALRTLPLVDSRHRTIALRTARQTC